MLLQVCMAPYRVAGNMGNVVPVATGVQTIGTTFPIILGAPDATVYVCGNIWRFSHKALYLPPVYFR